MPADIQRIARMLIQRVLAAGALSDLRLPPSHRLEALQGARSGQHSIRINGQWRVCFRWTEQGATALRLSHGRYGWHPRAAVGVFDQSPPNKFGESVKLTAPRRRLECRRAVGRKPYPAHEEQPIGMWFHPPASGNQYMRVCRDLAPAKGATKRSCCSAWERSCFNPRPREGGDVAATGPPI